MTADYPAAAFFRLLGREVTNGLSNVEWILIQDREALTLYLIQLFACCFEIEVNPYEVVNHLPRVDTIDLSDNEFKPGLKLLPPPKPVDKGGQSEGRGESC